jgi:two-component system cell cycle response regulator
VIKNDRSAVVLVADDSRVVRSLLRRQLEEQGHDVIEAVDGFDALERCEASLPDVVLLDIEMPNLDGHEVLERLRQIPTCVDIPVVFLTARTTTEDVVEGLRLGAHDYLRKPFEPSELLARVSGAVRVKRLQDELRQRNAELDAISRMDVVTGLPNRRHLLEHLHAESAAATRRGERFGVLMIDVDHFKKVNDRYGHESGDVVLRIIGERLGAACRIEDVAGRWGGEEFVIVAPATGLEDALLLAERARVSVGDTLIPIGSGAITVTVSIGVVAGADDIDELLRQADTALYEAKQSGRNCVIAAGPPTER